MTDILDEIENEIPDPPEDDGAPSTAGVVYDPSAEYDPIPVDFAPPKVRNLTAEEWGIVGEGTEEMWAEFVDDLNHGMIGGEPVGFRPGADLDGWEPIWGRSEMSERGKGFAVLLSMTPATAAYLEGKIGATYSGMGAAQYLGAADPEKVNTYAEWFEDGDRPEPWTMWEESDGEFKSFQEGRHRALAAEQAGVEEVPVVLIREEPVTGVTRRKDNFRSDYTADWNPAP